MVKKIICVNKNMSLEAYIVSINEDDIMTRHVKVGNFDTLENVIKHVNEMEIDYSLQKFGDLHVCVADLTDIKVGDIICPEHGPIESLSLEFFKIDVEE